MSILHSLVAILDPKYRFSSYNVMTFERVHNFAGGLSMNDFIVAAKIDQIKTSDLVPRKRVWA
jgi:hypothetical protein